MRAARSSSQRDPASTTRISRSSTASTASAIARGDVVAIDGHVVERAVRLDVLQPLLAREGGQRADLVDDVVADLGRRRRQVAAAEPAQVGKARVRPDRRRRAPRPARPCARIHPGSPGVESARDVRRRDVADDLAVEPKRVGAEAFAHVAVEVDLRRCGWDSHRGTG